MDTRHNFFWVNEVIWLLKFWYSCCYFRWWCVSNRQKSWWLCNFWFVILLKLLLFFLFLLFPSFNRRNIVFACLEVFVDFYIDFTFTTFLKDFWSRKSWVVISLELVHKPFCLEMRIKMEVNPEFEWFISRSHVPSFMLGNSYWVIDHFYCLHLLLQTFTISSRATKSHLGLNCQVNLLLLLQLIEFQLISCLYRFQRHLTNAWFELVTLTYSWDEFCNSFFVTLHHFVLFYYRIIIKLLIRLTLLIMSSCWCFLYCIWSRWI